MEMNENNRCSTLFHFDVPGGKWHTVTCRPVSAANSANLAFHAQGRLPLDPPQSAVISNRSAPGYRSRPTLYHQARIALTANAAVSWSTPTLTNPSSAPTSYTPYGMALGTPPGKACPLTCTGCPAGCHSRPLLAYSPTSSFFFVSTEMTGSPAARNRPATVLMCPNCASRSGCCAPSLVVNVACNRYPACLSSRATVVLPTTNPAAYNAFTRWFNDFVVHRNGDIGSPRVSGATNASNASATPGCASSTAGRPAPAARTRPSATTPARISFTPACTVVRETPDTRATNAIPPRPNASASAPNSNRHCRSFRCGLRTASFSARARSVVTPTY